MVRGGDDNNIATEVAIAADECVLAAGVSDDGCVNLMGAFWQLVRDDLVRETELRIKTARRKDGDGVIVLLRGTPTEAAAAAAGTRAWLDTIAFEHWAALVSDTVSIDAMRAVLVKTYEQGKIENQRRFASYGAI